MTQPSSSNSPEFQAFIEKHGKVLSEYSCCNHAANWQAIHGLVVLLMDHFREVENEPELSVVYGLLDDGSARLFARLQTGLPEDESLRRELAFFAAVIADPTLNTANEYCTVSIV